MSTHWSYDASAFNSTTVGYYAGSVTGDRYQIRMWIQDTNPSRQLFQDEEIDWQQTREANKYNAAASLCDILVARAGSVKSKRISELSITYDPAFYRYLAGILRARGMGNQVPYVGGTSVSDKLAQQSDTDWVPPIMQRGLDNNPAAPQPATPAIGGSTDPLSQV